MAKSAVIDNFTRIMQDLRSKNYRPIYVLMGMESYFIDQISAYITQNVLSESEQEFNLITFHDESITAGEIVVASQRYPMMCDYQVIVVKDAYKAISTKSDDNLKVNPLELYAKNPAPSTILALCLRGRTIDKRTSFYKDLCKVGEVFESEPFKDYDESLLSDWISAYLRGKGCTIERSAAALIVEAIGVELNKIVNELDRLQMMLPTNTAHITAQHVELLGINKDFNSFELCKALMQKDAKKTFLIINYFSKTPKGFDLPSTLGAIFSQFERLFGYLLLCKAYKSTAIPDADLQSVMGNIHPYIVKKEYAPAAAKFNTTKTAEIISAIRSCDMRSKGWNGADTNSTNLLKELAFFILH